jgi:lysophospholipase L1-like esterase
MSISFAPPPNLGITQTWTAPQNFLGNTYLGSELTSTGATVIAGPYPAVTSGSANFGPTGGQTSREWINVGHILRIRQTGTITQMAVYLPATTGITGFYLKIWRADGSNFDLVGTSSNLVSSLVSGTTSTISISPGIAVQEGDYIGGRVEWSGGASVENFYAAPIALTTQGSLVEATIYSVDNTTPTTPGYNWTAQTATTSAAVIQSVYMAAPDLAMMGDSITSGYPTTISYIDPYNLADVTGASYPFKLAHALGYTYQNMGIGGQRTDQMASRFASDIVALSPRIVVIMGGVNDVLQGITSNATIIANITSMLNAAHAAGIAIILIGVTPFININYVSATPTMLEQRDALNASLQTLVTGSPYFGTYISPDFLGQFYSGGTAGNLWILQPRYDSGDGIHPNPSGYNKIAKAVATALNNITVQTDGTFANLTVKGDISLNGDTSRLLGVTRNTITGYFGNDFTISAGGAAQGSTNQTGGDLVLQSGVSTGSGSSSIILQPSLAGSSGYQDNAPSSSGLIVTGVNGIAQAVIGGTVPAFSTTQLEIHGSATTTFGLFGGGGSQGSVFIGGGGMGIATTTNTNISVSPHSTTVATFTSAGLILGTATSFDTSGILLELYATSLPTMQLFGTGVDFRLYNNSTTANIATVSNSNINIQPHSTTVATFTPTGLNITGTLGLTVATWADNQTVTAGQISVDANYIYVATAANTVKRVALSSF